MITAQIFNEELFPMIRVTETSLESRIMRCYEMPFATFRELSTYKLLITEKATLALFGPETLLK